MYKKRLILWSIISLLNFTLAIEGNAATTTDDAGKPLVGVKRSRPAAGGAGSEEANTAADAALAPARLPTGTVAVAPFEALPEDPSTPIQQAIEIIDNLLALKDMDPYLLTEAPASSPSPDFTKWKGLKRNLHFFYSEVEEDRIRAFQQSIQEPLFIALQLFARITHDHPQTFANTPWLHPLGYFMAFDTFSSSHALNKLKLLFSIVEKIGKEMILEKARRIEEGKPPAKPGKISNPTIEGLERQRDAMFEDMESPINRFAHYLYDVQGLKLVEEVLKTVEAADPHNFTGRLSILRSLQVMGEIFKNFSPIVMQSVDEETFTVVKRLRNVLSHFNKRRFLLIQNDSNAALFAAVKAEVLAFNPRFLEIKSRRTAIEKKEPPVIWAELQKEVDPLERSEGEWKNLRKLLKSWNNESSNPNPTLLESVTDLIDILEAMRNLAGIETDCILEAEKAAWAAIAGGKLSIMQSVWQQVQTPTLKPSELEALNTALPAAARETLGRALYRQAYPGEPTLIVSNEFTNARSRTEFDEAMAVFTAIQEGFITHMEANADSLRLLGIDVHKIASALGESSRATRSVGLRIYEMERDLLEDPWLINPPEFLIQQLADPTKAVKPWPIPPTETPIMRASRRAALEGLLPIICRQAIETLGTNLPIALDLRELGNYYAHPQPGYRDKPHLGFTTYLEPTQALAQDVGFLTLNLYHILQRFRKNLLSGAAGSAGAGAASGGRSSTPRVAMDEE